MQNTANGKNVQGVDKLNLQIINFSLRIRHQKMDFIQFVKIVEIIKINKGDDIVDLRKM